MGADLVRSISFDPAYDRTHTDPKKNYGIHGVAIRFILKGDLGAVQFVLSTSWQLPEVTQRLMRRPYEPIGDDPHWMERPRASDLGYHSPTPRYEGQTDMGRECHILGVPCFYDGSTLNAQPVFERLLREGDAGVWAALEEYYTRTFVDGGRGGFGQILHEILGVVKEQDAQ